MNLRKTVLATMTMPYPLGLITVGGRPCLVTATEDHGPTLLATPPYQTARQILDGPGGCMALLDDPERADCFYCIMGCFLGYKFQTGAVYRAQPDPKNAEGPWALTRLAELPFAHRIGLVRRAGVRYLIAASIAQDKKDAADWSLPGCVYACPVPAGPGDAWKLKPVLPDIHRNHGFLIARLDGKPSLLISGAEGLLATDLGSADPVWRFDRVLRDEVSEMALADLDGDGQDELATIEPFHGSRLSVYRHGAAGWSRAWEGELEYGHCLISATWGGGPCLLVSNRSESKDLVLYLWRGKGMERQVIDTGVGAANMLVSRADGTERIFSTNQATREIAMYVAQG